MVSDDLEVPWWQFIDTKLFQYLCTEEIDEIVVNILSTQPVVPCHCHCYEHAWCEIKKECREMSFNFVDEAKRKGFVSGARGVGIKFRLGDHKFSFLKMTASLCFWWYFKRAKNRGFQFSHIFRFGISKTSLKEEIEGVTQAPWRFYRHNSIELRW